MTKQITFNDICESTNGILRHARNKAATSQIVNHPDAYVIGYFSGFIETFLLNQTDAVRQDYVDHVTQTIKNHGSE